MGVVWLAWAPAASAAPEDDAAEVPAEVPETSEQSPDPPVEVVERQQSVDLLQVAGAADPASTVVLVRQGSSSCAGVFIDGGGHVATAYHCIADGARARVITRDGRSTRARVVSRLPSYDLAILDASALAGEPWLAVRTEPLGAGTVVRVWGHPLGTPAPEGYLAGTLRWSVSEGIVASIGPRAVQITAPVNAGNSGGPVVDEDGQLVGIVSRRLRGDGLGFASRAEPLTALLEEPRRGSILGGSYRAALVGSLFGAEGGSPSAGIALEIAARDHVVLGGSVAWAPQPHFDALRYVTGRATWSAGELYLGARLRAGSGYWTLRTDVFGGLAVVQTVERIGEPANFQTAVSQRVAPLLGGRISLALIAIDVGLIPNPASAEQPLATRTSMMLLWPGRLGVF